MMAGVSGDFGRLTGTINALNMLARVPSRVARVAAPLLQARMKADTEAGRDPYGRAYSPHMPATIRRYGQHQLLKLSGAGIDSLKAVPASGAGIEVSADEHMTFTQAGTPTQDVRAVLPNMPVLPATWNRILERSAEQELTRALKVAT